MSIRFSGALRATTAGAIAASLSLPATLMAQSVESQNQRETVVVTATRQAQPLSRVLVDITVLEREAIERSGATSLADLLARQPGIEFARNGGPGGTTSVFLRGAESRHTAVYIDGVRVDSQATGGAPWELIAIDQIERIEVLRGPAAAVYGSDAVGGVVQLFTRRGAQGQRASAALSYGSQNTAQLSVAMGRKSGDVDVALSASHGRSDGFNARPGANNNPDNDGWRRSNAQASAGLDLTPVHRVEAALLASRLWAQFDQGKTDNDVSRQRLGTVNLGWRGQWSASSSSRVNWGESTATYESQPSFYRTETTLRNLVLQHEQRWGDQLWHVTLERKQDQLLNPATQFSPTLAGSRTQDAVALAWRVDMGAHALQAHVRHDHDSAFGNQPTASLAWGWGFSPGWRVTASAATSFRAPTLYQRFSEYGLDTLKPEFGRNLEMGLRWAANGHELSAVAWRNRVQDLIVFGGAGPCVSPFGCYENASRVRYEGVTLAGATKLAGWRLRGSLDWHDPRNLDTGKRLARRASRLATLGADTDWAGWRWQITLQAAGARFDDAANSSRLGGYALLNLGVERALAPDWVLHARVDNLADKHYQLAGGFPQAGRSLQLGLRWAMR